METPATMTRTWMSRVWNQMESSAIDELLAADAPVHGLGETPLIGPAGFHEFHSAFAGAFADIQITVEDQVVEGDKVASRWSGTMTHRGTGTGVTAGGMVVLVVRDGMIREAWNAADFVPMLIELGFLPPDALDKALTPSG